MGWGTFLTTDIYFDRKTYTSIDEVKEDIKKLEEDIQWDKEELLKLVYCTEPIKLMSEDEKKDSSPDFWLKNEFKSVWECLLQDVENLYKLKLLEEKWGECHDEKGNPIRRKLSVEVVPGDEKRYWEHVSQEELKEKFSNCDNYLPLSLISGDFIFKEE